LPTKSLQLDGPNLEELLARAMTEAGPCGRVASADRVRRGGIGGFFAREHFEVTIEIEDVVEVLVPSEPAGATAPQSTATASARSWSDLAEGTEDVLELSSGHAPVADAAATSGDNDAGALAAAVVPAVRPLGSEAREPSTQKASFAALLSAIARDTLTAETEVEPDSVVSDAADADPPVTATVSLPLPAVVSEPSSVPRAVGVWINAIASATEEPVVGGDLVALAEAAPRRATALLDTASLVGPGLASLGLPAGLLPDPSVLDCLEGLRSSEDAQTYVQVALTTALQQLPEAPMAPERAGAVMVIAGELDRALEFGGHLADRAGIDLDTIVVASQARHRRGIAARQLIATPEEACDLAARCRRASHPTVVVMHAPVSAAPDRWAARLLTALAPEAVWGVAASTHKAEDLAAWAGGLGGLDALAMEDVSATTSPAQALAAGIPIACLDGQRATPALWAALIASRLLIGAAGAHAAAAQEV
jgi:hypothetical protein